MFGWLHKPDRRYPTRKSGWDGVEAWLSSPDSEWFRAAAVFGDAGRASEHVMEVLFRAGIPSRVQNGAELGYRARAAVLRDGIRGIKYAPLL